MSARAAALPRVVVVGGVDPSGGAGLSLDARVLAVHGVLAQPVVTALTVQDRTGFRRAVPVDAELLGESLEAALADGDERPAAIKIGLLAEPAQAALLAGLLRERARGVPLVVDPVLSATAGGLHESADLARAYRRELVPLAALLTPNLPELAAVLGGDDPSSLLAAGCGAVLIKGGHGAGAVLVDRLVDRDGERRFEHERLATGPVRGTGCALASAICAHVAHGAPLGAACARAIDWLQRCLGALPPRSEKGAASLPRPLALVSPS